MIELHPLIDVVDDATKREAMILLSNIISWLAITLDSNEEYKKYILEAPVIIYGGVYCDDVSGCHYEAAYKTYDDAKNKTNEITIR